VNNLVFYECGVPFLKMSPEDILKETLGNFSLTPDMFSEIQVRKGRGR
jgi:hypothetical protein